MLLPLSGEDQSANEKVRRLNLINWPHGIEKKRQISKSLTANVIYEAIFLYLKYLKP
jgi:hypothetical protein